MHQNAFCYILCAFPQQFSGLSELLQTGGLRVQHPVLGGGHAKAVPEGRAEYTFAGEAGLEADIFYSHSGVFQQIFCIADSGMDNVFMGGKAGLFLKSADEMILAETGNICQFFYGKGLAEMFIDISDDFFCHFGFLEVFCIARGI